MTFSQPPQATGTTANSARNGRTTKAQSPIKVPFDWAPSVSGFCPRAVAVPVGVSMAVVVMAPRWSWVEGTVWDTYDTVTYGSVV
ncbi:hypothetical protein GCM10009661_07520 [Catellatospora chokoriensis]|uniref:Uncharacterized protein n=1 Tax=Catellatospora chokoriensis TaxID=310353 RepID=A0A8J3JXZ2_9ACTN|nr:hypothetical protein Cch02nite_24620 [Catellatospora chokoriensis]